MLNKGWAVTALGSSPSPFSQSLFPVLYLVLLSWAWLWSGFSFWKWQVISQYVFTICIRLSKEATNGLCHGTVSARFLGTSSDAERAANAREFNSAGKHLTSSFTVQCRSHIWAEAPWKVTSVCAVHTRAASALPGALREQGMQRGMNCCDSMWSHFTSSWHWCCCSKGEFLKPFLSFQTGFLHTPSKLLHIFQREIFAVRLPLLLTVNNI